MVKEEKEKVYCLLGFREMIGATRPQGDSSGSQKYCSTSMSLFLGMSVCICVLMCMHECAHAHAIGQSGDQSAVSGVPCNLYETSFSDEYTRLAGLPVSRDSLVFNSHLLLEG